MSTKEELNRFVQAHPPIRVLTIGELRQQLSDTRAALALAQGRLEVVHAIGKRLYGEHRVRIKSEGLRPGDGIVSLGLCGLLIAIEDKKFTIPVSEQQETP